MTKRIFGLISLTSALVLTLSACTTSTSATISSEKAVEQIPSSTASASPEQSPDLLKEHAEILGQSYEPFQILNEVKSVGSTTLRIGKLPEGCDSVGFMISCEPTSEWNVLLPSGAKAGSSDCDSNSGFFASISVPKQQINADEVQLELTEKVPVWVTVFATNEIE